MIEATSIANRVRRSPELKRVAVHPLAIKERRAVRAAMPPARELTELVAH